jgi:hypothetical protein
MKSRTYANSSYFFPCETPPDAPVEDVADPAGSREGAAKECDDIEESESCSERCSFEEVEANWVLFSPMIMMMMVMTTIITSANEGVSQRSTYLFANLQNWLLHMPKEERTSMSAESVVEGSRKVPLVLSVVKTLGRCGRSSHKQTLGRKLPSCPMLLLQTMTFAGTRTHLTKSPEGLSIFCRRSRWGRAFSSRR